MQVCSIKWNTCTVNINIKKLLWKRKRNKKRQTGENPCLITGNFSFPHFSLAFFLFLYFCCWPSFPSESLLHNLFPPLSLVWPSVWPSLPPFSLWAFNSSSAVKYFQPRICAGEQRTGLVTEHDLRFLAWFFVLSIASVSHLPPLSFHLCDQQANALIRSLCQCDNALVYITDWDAPPPPFPLGGELEGGAGEGLLTPGM